MKSNRQITAPLNAADYTAVCDPSSSNPRFETTVNTLLQYHSPEIRSVMTTELQTFRELLRPGDRLVVMRIDRPARSIGDLSDIVRPEVLSSDPLRILHGVYRGPAFLTAISDSSATNPSFACVGFGRDLRAGGSINRYQKPNENWSAATRRKTRRTKQRPRPRALRQSTNRDCGASKLCSS